MNLCSIFHTLFSYKPNHWRHSFFVKPCPHCRRKVRLSQKTTRQRRQSHFSATVWTGL